MDRIIGRKNLNMVIYSERDKNRLVLVFGG